MGVNYNRLPESLRDGVRLYLEHGIPPGSFLEAVISNDLRGSLECADEFNRRFMFEIVSWFYNECPHDAWGSPEIYRDWITAHREKSA